MARTTCYVCKCSKAQPCKTCNQLVCKTHRDLYFNETSRNFTMLCHNCGKKSLIGYAPRIRAK